MDKAAGETNKGHFRVDDLDVDLDRQSVQRRGQRIELPDLSFRLFAVLVSRAPHHVGKDELIREVWGNVVVGDETLAQRVRLLRQALGEDSQNPRYISSVRGRGYRLICDVSTRTSARLKMPVKWGLAVSLAVILVSAAVILFRAGSIDTLSPITAVEVSSIAVLPFTDLSPEKNYGYFADGMHEELLTRLTKLGSMEVLSRTSVEAYRSTDLSLTEIAKLVDVGLVIEGSVRITDNRVRITVQLIDGVTDRHLWAKIFERELSMQNIFSIQEEVADQIAQALELEYDTVPRSGPAAMPTAVLEAYDAYLLGRFHTFRQTPEDLVLAVTYLEKATALDAEFAEAFAALGWAYSFLGTNYGQQPPHEVYPRAKKAALTALSLDSELADARSLYADILTWYDWDFVAAEREFLKTLEYDPINVLGYALFLTTQERHDEAIVLIEKRLAADPNNAYVHINAAWRFYSARQYERTIKEVMLAGNHTDARPLLAYTYLAMGETDRAIDLFESDIDRQGRNAQQLSNLAYAYFRTGRRSQGNEILAELLEVAEKEFVSPAAIAAVYFAADRVDEGFVLLQRAIDVRAREMIFIQTDHTYDAYREDPRYLALIRAIGFGA